METNNTPEVKDPKEFQERLDRIKANIQSKKDAEGFVPSKEEEEIPTPDELKEEPKPKPKKEVSGVVTLLENLGFAEAHIKTILALLVRDKEFYEMFAPWIKPYDFATVDPEAPHEAMETVWMISNDHFKKYGKLITQDILKQEILYHFKQYKKNEQYLTDWYNLVDEVFDAVGLEDVKDWYAEKMAGFIQVQELKLSFHKVFNEMQKPVFAPAPPIKNLYDQVGKILELGVKDQADISIDAEEFLKIEFPPRKTIIHPWLKEQSTGMTSGPAGSGKTFLGLSGGTGVTTQTPVGLWEVKNPIPCIYVDGELSEKDLHERLKGIGIGKAIKKLKIVSDAFNVSRNLPRINNLVDPNQRATLFRMCQKHKDPDIGLLLFLDNISVLFPGIDENKKSDWDPINVWLLDLKKSGICSHLFHHTGKSGDQRGTSAHIDNLDTSILLSLPKDYKTEDGCRFNLHFKKNRVDGQYLHLIRDQEWKLNTKGNPFEWIITTSTKKSSDEIFLLLAQGMGVTEIAKTLKISHSYVSKIKTRFEAQGFLDNKGNITPKGKLKLDSANESDDLEDE